MAISADHVSIIAFQLMWESLSACPCGTTYGPCQHCMNYSDICEQLLRNHFCLPERGKKAPSTLSIVSTTLRVLADSSDALGAILYVSLRVRPYWHWGIFHLITEHFLVF